MSSGASSVRLILLLITIWKGQILKRRCQALGCGTDGTFIPLPKKRRMPCGSPTAPAGSAPDPHSPASSCAPSTSVPAVPTLRQCKYSSVPYNNHAPFIANCGMTLVAQALLPVRSCSPVAQAAPGRECTFHRCRVCLNRSRCYARSINTAFASRPNSNILVASARRKNANCNICPIIAIFQQDHLRWMPAGISKVRCSMALVGATHSRTFSVLFATKDL